ncbi:11176_t:CDS:2, partial [Diversispora eburnea]
MSDSSTSGSPSRSTRIQLASKSNMQTQLKNQRNNPIKKVDKSAASFISKEPTNIKSNIKNNSDIKDMEVTVTIEQPETEVTNKKKKAKNMDNTAIDSEVIEEDKESVLSYEIDNSEKIEFVKKAIRAKTELTLIRVEDNRKDKMISVLFDNKENMQAALEINDSLRVIPTNCSYDNLMTRGKFAARMINLPSGITAKEIIPNIKTIGALTCYIPRSHNYRCRSEAIISFVNEEALEVAIGKEWKA